MNMECILQKKNFIKQYETLADNGMIQKNVLSSARPLIDCDRTEIEKYLNYNDSDIRSCFYHVGKTDVKSIFLSAIQFPYQKNMWNANILGNIQKYPIL